MWERVGPRALRPLTGMILPTEEKVMKYNLSDGDSECEIEAADNDVAEAAAREWIRGGDYLDPETPRTTWVDCRISGNDEEWTITVQLDPPAPVCIDRWGVHFWKEVPDSIPWHGGGIKYEMFCKHCGAYKHIDNWAQRPDTGEERLVAVWYSDPDSDTPKLLAKANAGIHVQSQAWQEAADCCDWHGVWPVIDAEGLLTGEISEGGDDMSNVDDEAMIETAEAIAAGWTVDEDGYATPPEEEA